MTKLQDPILIQGGKESKGEQRHDLHLPPSSRFIRLHLDVYGSFPDGWESHAAFFSLVPARILSVEVDHIYPERDHWLTAIASYRASLTEEAVPRPASETVVPDLVGDLFDV